MTTKIQETKMPDGHRILTAWERRSAEHPEHGTITTIEDIWYGKISTRRLPAHLNALPNLSDERYEAVTAYHESIRQEAYAAILAARPDAEAGTKHHGEIWLDPL